METVQIKYITFNWYFTATGQNPGFKQAVYENNEDSTEGKVISIKEMRKGSKMFYRVFFQENGYMDIHNPNLVRWVSTKNT